MKPYHQKLLAGLLTTGIPVGYMITQHLFWMPDQNARRRMALKHAGFWGGLSAGLVIFHRHILRAAKQPFTTALAIAGGASLLPIAGYEVSRRLAKTLFPKTSVSSAMPSTTPAQTVTLPQPNAKVHLSQQNTPQPYFPHYGGGGGYSTYTYPMSYGTGLFLK